MDRKTHFRQSIKPNTTHRQPCAWPYAYIGTAKDELPKGYIPSRTLIGSGDAAFISINQQMFVETGMTIHYASLDGRRFVTSVYMLEKALKHDFEEVKS